MNKDIEKEIRLLKMKTEWNREGNLEYEKRRADKANRKSSV